MAEVIVHILSITLAVSILGFIVWITFADYLWRRYGSLSSLRDEIRGENLDRIHRNWYR